MNRDGADNTASVARPVPMLRRGDVVGVAAPASPVPREEFLLSLHRLQRMGLRPRFRDDLFDRHLYLARSDAARASELAELFLDPEIKAVFCACPGYGSLRVLPHLPWDEIRQHPKFFMGYSDLTALLVGLTTCGGFCTFHGPALVPGFLSEFLTARTWRAVRQTLLKGTSGKSVHVSRAVALGTGCGSGPLVGGNLEMLTSLLGTPWEPRTAGGVLFIEEVGEGEETLDQRLTHLRLAGKLDGVKAVLFGDMSRNDLTPPYRVLDVVKNVLGDLGVPVLIGFPAGHGRHNLPLVLGARYSVCADSRTVTQLDPGMEIA